MSKSIIVFVAILAFTVAFSTKPNTILSKAQTGGPQCNAHSDCNSNEYYCDKFNNCFEIQGCPYYNDAIDGTCPSPPPSPRCENNDKNDGQCGDRDVYMDHACWVSYEKVPEELMQMVQHNDNLEICGANAQNSGCSFRSENWFCLGVATPQEMERRFHAAQQAQQQDANTLVDDSTTGGQGSTTGGQGSNNGGQGTPEHPKLDGQCMMFDDNQGQCGDANANPDGFVCFSGPEPDFTRQWDICGSVDDGSECANGGNYLCLACQGDHDFCQGGRPSTGGQGQGPSTGGQGQGSTTGGQGQGSTTGGQGQATQEHPRAPNQCMMMDINQGQCGDRAAHPNGFACFTGGPEPDFARSWGICGSVDADSECANAGGYLCLACEGDHDFCQ